MENRRRVSLLLVLLLEVSGLVFASFVFSSDSFFTQELQLKSNITLCVGNATCQGEITLGLFSGWKAIDSGLGINLQYTLQLFFTTATIFQQFVI